MLEYDEALDKRMFIAGTGRWEQPCLSCEVFFSPRAAQRYCSKDCRNAFLRQRYQQNKTRNKPKICLVCNEVFFKGRSDKVYCSEKCGNKFRGKKWERDNPEKVKIHRQSTRQRSWQKYAVSRLKHKAKKLNLPFDLVPRDLEKPVFCSVLGYELDYEGKKSGYSPNRASVDRLVPSLGYVKGNVRVISARANLLKNDATVEELELVLADLKTIAGKKNEVGI